MNRSKTALPFTYVHDGRYTLTGEIDQYIAELRLAPPTIYHVTSLTTPLPNTSGAAIPLKEDPYYLAPPEEIARRLETAKRWTAALHAAGVRWVIPYTCNQALGGVESTRSGIWKFWDHWDQYTDLGIGPRPELDPIHWIARERNGELHFTYEMRHSGFGPFEFRYAPCLNNPYFNQYQRANARMIAMAGYDGVFMDNNNLNCYCRWCTARFREWMIGRHTRKALRDLFGWSSPEEIELGWRGSRFEWLKEDPLFREFVAETLGPEERVHWFGTDDMAQARLPEAGNGWLWGRGNEYVRWVYARLSPEERERRWGSARLEGWWGIRNDGDRLLWAETKRFWADSVRQNHEKVQQWGNQVLGRHFLVVPNWGNLQQFEDIAFREPIGHDVRLWSPGCDMIFWEDDGDAGRVAPGVFLDFALEYRLAFAHDMRSACMAALTGDEPTCALAHAEAAATGGSAFIQRLPEFPQLRASYTRLFETYGDWYEGYTSAARVGLAFSVDNLHLENADHIHQVYRLSQYLNDQQVPFDYLLEEHLGDVDYLLGYRVVVAPAVRYLAREACRALAEFVERGGTLVAAGPVGTHDMNALPRRRNPLASLARKARKRDGVAVLDANGRFIGAECLEALLPPGQLTREDMIEIAVSAYRAIRRSGSRHTLLKAEDYAVNVERFLEAGRLGALVPGWERLRIADPYRACGLRVFPYVRLDGTAGSLVAHLVNYNVDLTGQAGSRKVDVLCDTALRLEVPDGWLVQRAEWLVPGADAVAIAFTTQDGAAAVVAPRVETYALVRLTLAPGVARTG